MILIQYSPEIIKTAQALDVISIPHWNDYLVMQICARNLILHFFQARGSAIGNIPLIRNPFPFLHICDIEFK